MTRLPVLPTDRVACAPLHAVLPARVCVARQDAARGPARRSAHAVNGPGRERYPTCFSCPQGRDVRAALAT